MMYIKFIPTLLLVLWLGLSKAQHKFSGIVVAQNGHPIEGANLRLLQSGIEVFTNRHGEFSVSPVYGLDTLMVTHVGYLVEKVPLQGDNSTSMEIVLTQDPTIIKEVLINTGYYQIPQERATGSFTHVNNALLSRSVGQDILSRLEGVTNSLDFDRRLSSPLYGEGNLSVRVRGLSTLNSDNAPLIILDNFPYEGDLQNLNPNDIESVTLLKDAAAASIWGAKAANGVIVINTKSGRFDQQIRFDLASNVTLGERPNLFYSPRFIASADFIAIERDLFSRGFYDAQIASPLSPPLSPVVELLVDQKLGLIDAESLEHELAFLERIDMRREVADQFYRNSAKRNYALSARGGSHNSKYYLSAGLDRTTAENIRDNHNRFTFNGMHSIRLLDHIEVSTNIAFMQSRGGRNRLRLEDISPAGWDLYPYARLADGDGQPLPIPRNHSIRYASQAQDFGLLDWLYRPIDELWLSDNNSIRGEKRLGSTLRYEFNNSLVAEVSYNYQSVNDRVQYISDKRSYVARHQVNRFTQLDGTRVFPEGGTLDQSNHTQSAYSGRAQLSYRGAWENEHRVHAIGGMEMRQTNAMSSNFSYNGYDDDILTYYPRLDYQTRYPVRPQGTSQLPIPLDMLNDRTDRFVSYYSNATYDYDHRYALSLSARNDASNLFGVKTNQKWVPLWSAGVGWGISNERFYRLTAIPRLKLRLTYGVNGNVDKSVTAYTTARYATNSLTGLPQATITSPGNPNLGWEKVGVFNVALDFGLQNERISGSIEYFQKNGRDLIGQVPLDRTTGFLASYQINHADIRTTGVDVEVHTKNLTGNINWESVFLVNLVQDKVTNYLGDSNYGSLSDLTIPPIEGRPRYGIHSYPWFGLDGKTGDPLVLTGGELTKNYIDFIRSLQTDDFVYHGSAIPTAFGSVRNTMGWKNLEFSFTITWKAGYYFRRSTIAYDALFDSWVSHRDFYARWKTEGDENITNVPSLPDSKIPLRDQVYTLSEATVSKGDHIRLRDLRLAYDISGLSRRLSSNFKMHVFLYARNMGFLWRANQYGLDPDLPRSNFPLQREAAIGLNINF